MRKLSGREKMLIYITMLLLIACGGNWLFIQPANRTYEDACAHVEQLYTQKCIAAEKAASVKQVRHRYEVEREKLRDSLRQYESVSSWANLEEHVLSYMEEEHLEIVTTFMEDDEVEVKTEGESEEVMYMRTGMIEVSVLGEKTDFLRLLDKMAADPALCVNGYDIYRENEPEGRWSMEIDIAYAVPGSMEDMRNEYGQEE